MIKGLYEAHLPVSNLEQSIEFYEKLGLELASKGEDIAFFWIEKGRSWLGLWQSKTVNLDYHPSIRHIAFYVELDDLKRAKAWLLERGISIRTAFGFRKEEQPLVLTNTAHAHGAIYFNDPDGNSLEFIVPLQLDTNEQVEKITLEEWEAKYGD